MKNQHYKLSIFAALLLFLAAFSNNVAQAAPPANFQRTLLVGSGLAAPTAIEFAPDGRLFILELGGGVRIYKDGALLPGNFATLPAWANADNGLLGIAMDPEFNSNHYIYFYFIDAGDRFHKVVRYNAAGDIGTDGPFVIYDSQMASGSNHAGGTIQFGPDGKLYLGIGDSGLSLNSASLSTPQGKIIRINKDGSIPSDNPFYSTPNARKEIWALGFRNPFRFQFDPLNGNLYAGDVGEASWEEVNLVTKGGNYGWPQAEGACSGCPYVNPIHAYFHASAGYSITGGPVYRKTVFPAEYQGNLFYADFARGFIRRLPLNPDGTAGTEVIFDSSVGTVVDMKIGNDGAMYYVTINPGQLFKVTYTLGNSIPTAIAGADITSGESPLEVAFSSADSLDSEGETLAYLWNFGDGTSSVEANPVKTYPARGIYVAELRVSDGTSEALAPALTIQVGTPPALEVDSPAEASAYKAGDIINYAANSLTGDIKLSVLLHHNIHIHPFLTGLAGQVGSFQIPVTGENAADTWYELVFTATDADGLSAKRSVRINPMTTQMTFLTSPAGMRVSVDGQPVADGTVIPGVVGFKRDLDAPDQVLGVVGYEFERWSDGLNKAHAITTPGAPASYTAHYRVVPPFNAEYFSNKALTGPPALTRQDQFINFDWGGGSPGVPLGNDNFSARWTKQHFFAAGQYEFTTSTDDGARLYIDGNMIIDDWQNHGETARNATLDLAAGLHEVRMEYYEDGGGAIARLGWIKTADAPQTPDEPTEFNVEYFNNIDLSGQLVLAREEAELDNVWYLGSPDPAVNADNFSARWIKSAEFTAGGHEFLVTADDGVRLYIDGIMVLDKWIDQAATSYLVEADLSAGLHEVKMEYYERDGNAVARLGWVPDGPPPAAPDTVNGYLAEYFPNGGLLGNPSLVRDDANISFDWAGGSPDAGLPTDNFSARWTRLMTFGQAEYLFNLEGDDGMRLFVGGELVIDGWVDQSYTRYSATKAMAAGQHEVVIEYYENAGSASINFSFSGGATPSDWYLAEYFNNLSLEGEPALTRQEEKIDYLFNGTSPDPAVGVGNFSARWTRQIDFPAGSHEFYLASDDGIRFYVDGVLVVDDWFDHGLTHYSPVVDLESGPHEIKVEYYQAGGGGVAIFRQ